VTDSLPSSGVPAAAAHPFATLADFVAIPRVGGLALSPDGTRLAIAVATLDPEKKKWQSAVWEVDPEGRRPARRLTRSGPGESAPAWAPDGSLLFTSARPDPRAAATGGDEPTAALWSLPAAGGEARIVLGRPGGIGAFTVAADSGDVVVSASTMPGAADAEEDEQRRKRRKEAGVTAILHDSYPVRF
jgi:dipeptidyl aminopeptidase/acylaminoacyl peptidase